jgi:hypothetical protein
MTGIYFSKDINDFISMEDLKYLESIKIKDEK